MSIDMSFGGKFPIAKGGNLFRTSSFQDEEAVFSARLSSDGIFPIA